MTDDINDERYDRERADDELRNLIRELEDRADNLLDRIQQLEAEVNELQQTAARSV